MKPLAFFFLFLPFFAFSQKASIAKPGYEIKVKINGFTGDTIKFGNIHEDKIYFQDTVVSASGDVTFKGENALQGGIYVVYLPKEKNYFQILVDKEQHFSVETTGPMFYRNMKFKGSRDNELFYRNIDFIVKMQEKAGAYRAILEKKDISKESQEYKDAFKAMEGFDKEVKEQQSKLIAENPESITAAILKATQPIICPEAPKLADGKVDSFFCAKYTKAHYFDGFNLADGRLVYTDFIKTKLLNYFEHYVVPDPDSMIAAADYVISLSVKDKIMYRYVCNKLLYFFETSKYVCMDRVFVHLSDKYFCNPNAPHPPLTLAKQEYLDKICQAANDMRLVQCGNLAPNLKLKSLEGEEAELHKIDADYILVFFWDPDCGHCKKVSEQLGPEYEILKSKFNLKVFGICTMTYDKIGKCSEGQKEKGMKWTNYADPYYLAKAKILYNIKTTPGIFLLDKDKKILLKKFEVQDLKNFLEKEAERKSKKK